MEWQPILEGELANRATQAVRQLGDALASLERAPGDVALFAAYAAAAFEDDTSAARADAATQRFAASLQIVPHRLGLFGGLAGLGWTAGHLVDGAEPALVEIDRVLLDALRGPWTRSYDLVEGLAGLAVYFIARDRDDVLALIVDHLAERAAAGWHSPASWGLMAEQLPDGHVNCGLAHGVPGAIAILAKLAARGHDKAAPLRDDAIALMRAQPDVVSWVGGPPARTAWCYGEPGLAIALSHTGVTSTGWLERPVQNVVDAGFCHGSAGLAHIANRLYHATGEPRWRDAARAHLATTLAYHQPGTGIGGFAMAPPTPADQVALLDGAVGVGLVLLAAISPVEPAWDALVLCDVQ